MVCQLKNRNFCTSEDEAIARQMSYKEWDDWTEWLCFCVSRLVRNWWVWHLSRENHSTPVKSRDVTRSMFAGHCLVLRDQWHVMLGVVSGLKCHNNLLSIVTMRDIMSCVSGSIFRYLEISSNIHYIIWTHTTFLTWKMELRKHYTCSQKHFLILGIGPGPRLWNFVLPICTFEGTVFTQINHGRFLDFLDFKVD